MVMCGFSFESHFSRSIEELAAYNLFLRGRKEQPRKLMTIELAPSNLSANFARLGETRRPRSDGGGTVIHCDRVDGHFVPISRLDHCCEVFAEGLPNEHP